MIAVICMCALAGVTVSLPLLSLLRANREASRVLVRRGDYLRTRRTRVASNVFGVRS